MANIYVRNGASPASPYSTWATAAATLQDAINNPPATNADTIWLAPDHVESVGSAQLWACPTTPGLRIMCAASNTVAPPTGLATTATLATTTNFNQTMTGFAYVYGLTFNTGASGNPVLTFGTVSGTNPAGITLERCTLALIATGATSMMQVGSTYSGGLGAGNPFKLIDCTLRFSNAGHLMRLYSGNVEFQRLAFHGVSTTPTTVFQLGPSVGAPVNVEFRNCDLSGKSYTNLFTVNGFQSTSRTVLRNSLLASGSNLYTGTLTLPGGHRFAVHNCDLAPTHINFAEHSALGIVEEETVIKRTGGATTSGGTTYCLKMSGSTNATELYPLRTPEMSIWNSVIDTPIDIVMEILRDSVTDLQNDDVWMEVSYPDDDANTIYGHASDGRTSQLTTAANQTSSSVEWTTTGITNVRKQKLEVTVSPSKIGIIHIRACLALNTVVYVDKPTITV